MPGLQWGRLQVDVRCRLRRGAWYRVVALDPLEATLDVNRRPHTVPRYVLEVVSTPPRTWTVVTRAKGPTYAVCPSCRERQALSARPRHLRCSRCRGEFAIAWNEAYLGA